MNKHIFNLKSLKRFATIAVLTLAVGAVGCDDKKKATPDEPTETSATTGNTAAETAAATAADTPKEEGKEGAATDGKEEGEEPTSAPAEGDKKEEPAAEE